MTAIEAFQLGRQNHITPSNLETLLTILTDPPMKPANISSLTGVTPSATTGTLDALEKQGWIERVNNRNDRRQKLAVPTLKAFEVFQPAILP